MSRKGFIKNKPIVIFVVIALVVLGVFVLGGLFFTEENAPTIETQNGESNLSDSNQKGEESDTSISSQEGDFKEDEQNNTADNGNFVDLSDMDMLEGEMLFETDGLSDDLGSLDGLGEDTSLDGFDDDLSGF